MPLVLSLLPLPVLSAAGNEETEAAPPLNLDELTLYTAPERHSSPVPQPEPGHIEESVAALRRCLEPYSGRIKPALQHGVQLGSDTYAYLSDPPRDFYPRAGVIGFSGILGLFLARGSRLKRLLYPAGLMATSAALYFPERAAAVARSTGDSVYEGAVQSYAAVEKLFKPQEPPKRET